MTTKVKDKIYSKIGVDYIKRAGARLPFAVEAETSISEEQLIEMCKELINENIYEGGAILLRGFNHGGVDLFKCLVEGASGSSINYDFGSTPRSLIKKGIYTATEYPAHQTIPLHNEQSYTNVWADFLWFYCKKAARAGGETPLADSREIYRQIPEVIRNKFIQKGVLYVRNYGGGFDLDWQDVFNTDSAKEVEKFCNERGIKCEWKVDGELKTSQVCQAHIKHKVTGELVWFNQAHLFHVSSLEENVRETLVELVGLDGLPRNAYYGDGSEIETSVLEEIRAIYEENTVIYSWKEGDMLVIDNILTAHGRRPFEGERKVYVMMT